MSVEIPTVIEKKYITPPQKEVWKKRREHPFPIRAARTICLLSKALWSIRDKRPYYLTDDVYCAEHYSSKTAGYAGWARRVWRNALDGVYLKPAEGVYARKNR